MLGVTCWPGSGVTRRKRLIVGVAVAVVVVCLFPVEESTHEFDAVNFRLRACKRARAFSFGFVMWERCGPVAHHPTAARLRELGVIGPVNEPASRWVLIKGRRPGVRGWHGEGKTYLRALGETSLGTPVPLPVSEQLATNAWVRWAIHDPAAARRFWARAQRAPADDWLAVALLGAARMRLERRPFPVDDRELEADARSALGLVDPDRRPAPATAPAARREGHRGWSETKPAAAPPASGLRRGRSAAWAGRTRAAATPGRAPRRACRSPRGRLGPGGLTGPTARRQR